MIIIKIIGLDHLIGSQDRWGSHFVRCWSGAAGSWKRLSVARFRFDGFLWICSNREKGICSWQARLVHLCVCKWVCGEGHQMAVSALEAIQVIEQQRADASHQLRVLKVLSETATNTATKWLYRSVCGVNICWVRHLPFSLTLAMSFFFSLSVMFQRKEPVSVSPPSTGLCQCVAPVPLLIYQVTTQITHNTTGCMTWHRPPSQCA